jgi:hypothetical protein
MRGDQPRTVQRATRLEVDGKHDPPDNNKPSAIQSIRIARILTSEVIVGIVKQTLSVHVC